MLKFKSQMVVLGSLTSLITLSVACISLSRPGMAGQIEILDNAACIRLVGGQNLCPKQNCSCAAGPCGTGGTVPCPTATTTCATDGAGGCKKVVRTTQYFCGVPDGSYPLGCLDFTYGAGTCANMYTSTIFQGPDCSYPAPANCATAAACGDSQLACYQL
jgi:hypothetical protein